LCRRKGIVDQFAAYLKADARETEALPRVISEVSEHRILSRTLSRTTPDPSPWSKSLPPMNAARFAAEIRNVALWLWQGNRNRWPRDSMLETTF
jgi:hypothetical protein